MTQIFFNYYLQKNALASALTKIQQRVVNVLTMHLMVCLFVSSTVYWVWLYTVIILPPNH